MAVFTGTGAAEKITPTFVDVSVTKNPPTAFPGPADDVIDGGGGDDTIDAAGGDDVIFGGAGNDVIIAGAGNDTIDGGAGNDNIDGGAGDDVIIGFDGTDTVDGGAGTDTIQLSATSADLNGAGDGQIDNIEIIDASSAVGAVTITLSAQTEGFTVIGSAQNDTITLNAAAKASSIVGGGGADTITGTGGNDTIVGFGAGSSVNGNGGTDTLRIINPADGAAISAAADANIKNGVKIIDASAATGAVSLNLTGQTAADEKFTVIGSAFDDTIKLNNQPGKVTAGDGNDTITGGTGADTISGGAGDDLIIGFTFGDKVDGGAGLDTLQINTAPEANALGTVGDSSIVDIEIIDGSNAGVGLNIVLIDQTEGFTIIGSAQADTIKAGAGDDVIVGFVGADTVDGGGGTANSIFLAATSTDLNSATDAQIKNIQVIGASTAVAGVNINLQNQTEGFVIVGSAQADTLTGGSGNDFFFGFKGADTVDGKGGQNAIVLDANAPDLNSATDAQVKNVQVVYAATATAGVTIDLKNQTEAITVQGSDFNDVITGTTAGDKYLAGGKGADTIDGGKGDDTILGEAGDDSLLGGEGNDSIFGGDGNDIIFGGDGKDIIFGEAGDDVLVAGFTEDTLVGGAGNDRFAFATSSLFNPGTAKVDVIADLAAGDFIVLSKTTFTAFTASSGDIKSGGTAIAAADFATIATGGAAAAGASSALIVYETSTGALYYNQDRASAGLGTGGQFASIAGAPALTASQILIVG